MHAWLLALCLYLSRCEVIVLGDSNSCLWPDGCLAENTHWPLYMTELPDWPPWTVKNRALSSMAAGDFPRVTLATGEPASGRWHLERIIREDLADACLPIVGRWVARRKLVIALGTNDVVYHSPAETGAAVVALYERARQVPCVEVYVATLPPRLGAPPGSIAFVNAFITLTVPANRIIPFGDEPVSDLETAAHVSAAGQRRRAVMAFGVLFPRASH